MDKVPGTTLEEALQTFTLQEKESIASEGITFLSEIGQNLTSPTINAARLALDEAIPPSVATTDFNLHRFKPYLSNSHVSTYLHKRLSSLQESGEGEQHLFSHCDLEPGSILICPTTKRLLSIIDWGQGGYLLAYWEWVCLRWHHEVMTGGNPQDLVCYPPQQDGTGVIPAPAREVARDVGG